AAVASITFSPDGRLLVSSACPHADPRDTLLHVWDVEQGRELQRMDGHAVGTACVAFSPNGRIVASGGFDGSIRCWEVVSGQEVLTLQKPQDDRVTSRTMVRSLAFSGDGRVLASGGSMYPTQTCYLWDLEEGVEALHFSLCTRELPAVAFAPDGKTLAFSSYQ